MCDLIILTWCPTFCISVSTDETDNEMWVDNMHRLKNTTYYWWDGGGCGIRGFIYTASQQLQPIYILAGDVQLKITVTTNYIVSMCTIVVYVGRRVENRNWQILLEGRLRETVYRRRRQHHRRITILDYHAWFTDCTEMITLLLSFVCTALRNKPVD